MQQQALYASIDGDYQAAAVLAGNSRNYSPSKDALQGAVRLARFTWTATGSLVNGDKVTLGALGLAGARVIPELCRVRGTGTGTPDVKFTLQKTDADGTDAVALTALSSSLTAEKGTVTLAGPGTGDTVALKETDLIKLVLSTGTSALTLAGTNTFVVEVGYSAVS